MALGGKVYDAINGIFRDHFADGLKVADVGLDESIVLAILYVLEIGEIAGIGKLSRLMIR